MSFEARRQVGRKWGASGAQVGRKRGANVRASGAQAGGKLEPTESKSFMSRTSCRGKGGGKGGERKRVFSFMLTAVGGYLRALAGGPTFSSKSEYQCCLFFSKSSNCCATSAASVSEAPTL